MPPARFVIVVTVRCPWEFWNVSLNESHGPCLLSGVSMPIPVIGLHNEDKVFVNGSCVLNEERFMLIGSFVAFFIPLVIMVVTYCLTIQVTASAGASSSCEYLPFFFVTLDVFDVHRCSRGRPLSSCTRQGLPPSSLCTHQHCQTRYNLPPPLSPSLRSTLLPPQIPKVGFVRVLWTFDPSKTKKTTVPWRPKTNENVQKMGISWTFHCLPVFSLKTKKENLNF